MGPAGHRRAASRAARSSTKERRAGRPAGWPSHSWTRAPAGRTPAPTHRPSGCAGRRTRDTPARPADKTPRKGCSSVPRSRQRIRRKPGGRRGATPPARRRWWASWGLWCPNATAGAEPEPAGSKKSRGTGHSPDGSRASRRPTAGVQSRMRCAGLDNTAGSRAGQTRSGPAPTRSANPAE